MALSNLYPDGVQVNCFLRPDAGVAGRVPYSGFILTCFSSTVYEMTAEGWRGGLALCAAVRMESRRLRPVAAVERAVLDGLGQVRDGEMVGAFQVGDGARDFEDAVVGAGGESLLLHGALEKLLGGGPSSQKARIWRVPSERWNRSFLWPQRIAGAAARSL